jgi:hypothetical protein
VPPGMPHPPLNLKAMDIAPRTMRQRAEVDDVDVSQPGELEASRVALSRVALPIALPMRRCVDPDH